jgi:hypothetical protein
MTARPSRRTKRSSTTLGAHFSQFRVYVCRPTQLVLSRKPRDIVWWQHAHMLVIYDDGSTSLSSEASVLYILRLALRDDYCGLFVVVVVRSR